MTSIHESCPPVGSGVEGLYGSPSHRGPQDRSAARPVRRADTIEQGFFIDEAEGSVIDKVADERRTQDDFVCPSLSMYRTPPQWPKTSSTTRPAPTLINKSPEGSDRDRCARHITWRAQNGPGASLGS